MDLKNKKGNQLIVRSILEVMHTRNQDQLLPDVSNALKIISDKKNSDTKAVVWTVFPLSSLQLKKINILINKITEKNTVTENKIDKDLIGGFKITIGDRVLDSSLKHDLINIENLLS